MVLKSFQVGGAIKAEYNAEVVQACFLTDTVDETEGGRMCAELVCVFDLCLCV